MPAYKKPIPKPNCWCGKPATFTVCNRWNERVGDYCAKHADRRVKELNGPDEQAARSET